MKIYILIEGESFKLSEEVINQDHNIKPVPTIEEALNWCERTAHEKNRKLSGSTLHQIRKGTELKGYKVTKGTDTYAYTFEEHELDLRTTCEKTQAALSNPKSATDLEVAQAYDHISECRKCQEWAWSNLHIGSNFDLQQQINKFRGKAP